MNALTDFKSLIERLEDSGARDKALTDAFLEVSTALADMLQLLEKQGPETAKTIAEALRSIKVDVSGQPELKMPEIKFPDMPAPVVNVTVPEFKIPAPVVNIERSGKKVNLTITPVRGVNGMATSYTITEN